MYAEISEIQFVIVVVLHVPLEVLWRYYIYEVELIGVLSRSVPGTA